MEGEVGRFSFALYEACEESGAVVCRGDHWFPKRQPREWHKTEGFREEALCLEASRRSYRDNTRHLNRYRRQWQGGTAVTTLQDNAQKEGARVLDFLDRHSQQVLAAHGFEGQGQPSEAVVTKTTAGRDQRLQFEEVDEQLAVVIEEMAKRGFSAQQIESVRQRAGDGVYEDPAHCTNVSVDDVQVKKQKAHRQYASAAEEPGSSAAVVAEPGGSGGVGRRRTQRASPRARKWPIRWRGSSKARGASPSVPVACGKCCASCWRFCCITICWVDGCICSPMVIAACRTRCWRSSPGIHGYGWCWIGTMWCDKKSLKQLSGIDLIMIRPGVPSPVP